MKEKFQRVGQVMLIPISVITIASFLMGLGSAFTSEGTIEALHLSGVIYEGSFLYSIFTILKASGSLVFNNLPVLFAVGSSFGLADKERGWSAFSGLIAFIAMHTIISTMFGLHHITSDTVTTDYLVKEMGMDQIAAVRRSTLFHTELGIFSYRLSIFGGLLIGIITSKIHNKLYNVKLPQALAFFGGTRSVPIVMLLAGSALGFVLYYVWPPIGNALSEVSFFINRSGLFGTFIWACMDKSLLPFGLHHLLTQPIRYTELGGSHIVDGTTYYGTTNIFMAQLASPTPQKLITRGFNSGRILIHFGGLVGAALAMYVCAPKNKRKVVAGILIPVVFTMVFFGVTEPIEFTFLFVAPWLFYLVHVPLTGLAFVLAEATGVAMFGGSVKDILPFLLQPDKLNILPYLWLVPMYFVIYFVVFRYLILKFNVKTPGREDSKDDIKLYGKEDYKKKKEQEAGSEEAAISVSSTESGDLYDRIIEGLGGGDNLEIVDNCMTRLRVRVKDTNKVVPDSEWRESLEAKGVVRQGNSLQIIYGTQVTMISASIRDRLDLD